MADLSEADVRAMRERAIDVRSVGVDDWTTIDIADYFAITDSWLALHAKAERLAGWKAEHLIVHADFQAIGKLIGVGLGQFVHDKIEPFLRAIIAERDDLRRRLEAAERRCSQCGNDKADPSYELCEECALDQLID